MVARQKLGLALGGMVALVSGCAVAPEAPVTVPTLVKKVGPLISVGEVTKHHAKSAAIVLAADEAPGVRRLSAAAPAFPYDITYVSQIPAPRIAGDPVQANDFATCGCGRAAIAYNTAGDIFAGAIQVIDTTDRLHPAVLKEIRFAAVDINAIATTGDTIWFGGQADPDYYPFKSFVGKFKLSELTPAAIAAGMKAARGHAVTSIVNTPTALFVGVGALDGGIAEYDFDLAPRRFVPRLDVRSIADGGNRGMFALSGTTDGGKVKAAASLAPVEEGTINLVPLGDFGSAYAKATVEIADNLAYLGLSRDGFQVRSIATGETRFALPNPTDSEKHTANAVSTDGDLAFIANGEYGFRVVSIANTSGRDATFGALAGFHELSGPNYDGKRYSANLVKYKDGNLFVASGLGGVNLYNLAKR